MFIQVIQGQALDRDEVKAMVSRWVSDVAPTGTGWLGTTAGVTAGGAFVALARFESEEAARRYNDRPEQDQWWAETSKLFDGEVTVRDSIEAEEFLRGGSDDAGFVQVITGQARDLAKMRALNEQYAQYAHLRPDLIGGVVAIHENGLFTQAAYFTSEAEARAAESKEPPEEMKAVMDEENDLIQGLAYIDLEQPWLHSPR
jgi:CRISPR/Cas system CMR-associated protein Cmr5 small subunit